MVDPVIVSPLSPSAPALVAEVAESGSFDGPVSEAVFDVGLSEFFGAVFGTVIGVELPVVSDAELDVEDGTAPGAVDGPVDDPGFEVCSSPPSCIGVGDGVTLDVDEEVIPLGSSTEIEPLGSLITGARSCPQVPHSRSCFPIE